MVSVPIYDIYAHLVRNDFTIVHEGRLYQILDRYTGRWVDMEERLDGRRYITSGQKRLAYEAITQRPLIPKEPKPLKTRKPAWIPGKEHPWKSRALIPA